MKIPNRILKKSCFETEILEKRKPKISPKPLQYFYKLSQVQHQK